MGELVLDSSGSEYEPVSSSCEKGNELFSPFFIWRTIVHSRLYFLDLIILGERSFKLTSNVNRAGSIIVVTTGNKIPTFYKFLGLYRIHKSMPLALVSEVTRKLSMSL
jgi:hypothetical protein